MKPYFRTRTTLIALAVADALVAAMPAYAAPKTDLDLTSADNSATAERDKDIRNIANFNAAGAGLALLKSEEGMARTSNVGANYIAHAQQLDDMTGEPMSGHMRISGYHVAFDGDKPIVTLFSRGQHTKAHNAGANMVDDLARWATHLDLTPAGTMASIGGAAKTSASASAATF